MGSIRNTITVIKTSNSFVFGGFTSADWNSESGPGISKFKYDENAFLFSLVNDYNTSVRMNITPSRPAIMTGLNLGLIFGQAASISIPHFIGIDSSDLYIDFLLNQGYSDIGRSYQLPSFLLDSNNKTNASKTFLAGSNIFHPVEIEVYYSPDRKYIFILLL